MVSYIKVNGMWVFVGDGELEVESIRIDIVVGLYVDGSDDLGVVDEVHKRISY